MYGWIIVNGFLYTSKFSELTDLFMEAAKEHKIDLFVKTNSECFLGMFELTTEKSRILFSFGTKISFWQNTLLRVAFRSITRPRGLKSVMTNERPHWHFRWRICHSH